MSKDTIYIHEVPDEPKERGFWYLFWRIVILSFILNGAILLWAYWYYGSLEPEKQEEPTRTSQPTPQGYIGQDKSEWTPINDCY